MSSGGQPPGGVAHLADGVQVAFNGPPGHPEVLGELRDAERSALEALDDLGETGGLGERAACAGLRHRHTATRPMWVKPIPPNGQALQGAVDDPQRAPLVRGYPPVPHNSLTREPRNASFSTKSDTYDSQPRRPSRVLRHSDGEPSHGSPFTSPFPFAAKVAPRITTRPSEMAATPKCRLPRKWQSVTSWRLRESASKPW